MMMLAIHRSSSSRLLLMTALAWLGLVLCVLPVTEWPSDDTYIHLRISRNLLEHGSLAFNPSQPTFSTTSPVWNILLAGAISAAEFLPGVDPSDLAVAQGLNLLMALLLLAAFLELYREHARVLVFLAALALALDPYLVYAAAGGMEMTLHAFLCVCSLLLLRRSPQGASGWPLALLLSLLPQVRPEGWLVAGAMSWSWGKRSGGLAATIRQFARVVVISLPWFLMWKLHLDGFLPASLIAKSTGEMGHLPLPSLSTLRQLFRMALPVYGPCVLLTIGGWILARRGARSRRPWAEAEVELLIVLGISSIYLLMLKEGYISSRYMVNLSPFILGITLVSVSAAEKSWTGRGHRSYAGGAAAALAALCLLYAFTNAHLAPKRNLRGRVLEIPRRMAGEWLREFTPEDAVVYANAIGYIGYYSRRTLIGGMGLIDPGGEGTALRSREIDEKGYLEWMRPDYAVLRSGGVEGAVLLESFTAEGDYSLDVWRMPWATTGKR